MNMWLAMRVKRPEDIFEPVGPLQPPLRVERRDGDPVGFVPVFATEAEARAAYPTDQIIAVVEAKKAPPRRKRR